MLFTTGGSSVYQGCPVAASCTFSRNFLVVGPVIEAADIYHTYTYMAELHITWVYASSYGHKWKTVNGRKYFTDNIGLSSTTMT